MYIRKFAILTSIAVATFSACGGQSGKNDSNIDATAADSIVVTVADGDSIRHTSDYIRQRIDSFYKHKDDDFGCSTYFRQLSVKADSICEAQGYIWTDGDHWINGQDKDEEWWYKLQKLSQVTDSTAVAEMLIHNFEDATIFLHLVYERGDWYVDDFRFELFDGKKKHMLSEKKRTLEFLADQDAL